MDLTTEKKVWSRNFWISKLLRTVILALLIVLLTQLWNWESQQDSTEVASVTESSQATPSEPVVEVPVEPAFPFEIGLPEGATGPVDSSVDGFTSYTYTFADGASMVVYVDGAPEAPTDTTWNHETVAATDKLSVTNIPTTLCAAGTTGCSAGNGVMDITSRPATGQTDNLVFVISDSNIQTKTFEQATAQYKAIIETVEVSR